MGSKNQILSVVAGEGKKILLNSYHHMYGDAVIKLKLQRFVASDMYREAICEKVDCENPKNCTSQQNIGMSYTRSALNNSMRTIQ